MAKNIKSFFAGLSWYREASLAYPIFTTEELEYVPLKRLKHLLLVYTGLRSFAELNKEIFRFAMSRDGLLLAKETCFNLLDKYHSTPYSALLILKIVFSNITMGLPNYRVTAPGQVASAFDEIEKIYIGKASEIWLCVSNVSDRGSNLGGRILFRLDLLYAPDVLEIVWFTSPRMLDNYRVVGYPYPYLKAIRLPGCLSFVVDSLTIPDKFSANHLTTKQKIFQDYNFVLHQLNKRGEQIANLCEILKLSKVKEVVIEFRVDSGHFQIIDWDTDSETRELW